MLGTNRRQALRIAGSAAAWTLTGLVQPAVRAESAKRRIKIGQIGVGHAHASKLAVYRDSPDYEVVGVVEPDEGLRQQAESQELYRDLAWMTTEQLLNVPGLEAVLVETRVRDLLDTAETCIAAGKHIHLDKPAGESLSQLRRIVAAAAQQNLLVQMGYMYRYSPAIRLLREMLDQRWLGDVFEVHTVMSKVVEPATRHRLAEYRGGIMFELGCHILDLVIAILGKPTRVTSFVQHAAPIEDSLEDNMLAVLEYPGAIATVKSSAMEVEGFARRHLVVCGTEGTFHVQPLDNPSVRLALARPRGPYRQGYQEVTMPEFTRYIADAADMARILRGEKQTDFDYEHDLNVQTALLQACAMQVDP